MCQVISHRHTIDTEQAPGRRIDGLDIIVLVNNDYPDLRVQKQVPQGLAGGTGLGPPALRCAAAGFRQFLERDRDQTHAGKKCGRD